MQTIESIYVSMICSDLDRDKFGKYLEEIAKDVRKIEGCIRFDYLQSPENKNRFVSYMEFDSEQSHQKYKASNAVNKINNMLFPLLTTPPIFRHYRSVVVLSSKE